MWEDLGGPEGKIERLACWDFILADGELAQIMGKGDPAKGKAMLQVMKAEHALDKNGDGVIQMMSFSGFTCRRIFWPPRKPCEAAPPAQSRAPKSPRKHRKSRE